MENTKPIELSQELFDILVSNARKATCYRSKCGSIIVSENEIVIGTGYNSMPCNVVEECFKDSLSSDFKSDKTCCVHAEQRAINDAIRSYPSLIDHSTLFFIRLDDEGNPKRSGRPYCTICSKAALDAGIKWFCLWHEEGWVAYDTGYYNKLSFNYGK